MSSFRRAVPVLLICLAGCARPAPPATITGVVSLDGKPLTGGRVTFLGPGDSVAANEIEPDGHYTVAAPPPGPAKVIVTGPVVTPIPARDPLAAQLRPPDRSPHMARSEEPPRPTVPAHYGDPALTPLSYAVTNGPQTHDIDLTGEAARAPDGPAVGLEPGQVAPDIEGPDLDGQAFRLNDYRGRVVLVYFWGHWCSLCREQYPQMRALEERYRGRPFALLGVNSDADREALRETVRKQSLPWRTWWDGDITGQVAAAWDGKGWPTLYLLDGRGVVRARNVRGAELDRAVDDLLRDEAAPP